MNRKIRATLATLGAVTFFIIFIEVSKSPAAAFIAAAIGLVIIWLLAGFLHWYWSKRMYYTYKNIEYMNKLASENDDKKPQEGENLK